MGWNIIMRFISLELCVLFVGQIRKQKNLSQRCATPNHVSAKLNTNWAVLLASGVLFVIVLALDSATDPHLLFLPLYLLPCMILTLVLGLRWGMAAAVVVATGRSLMEYTGDPNYAASEVFGWNLAMRLAVFLVVILLLDRIRRDNILFSPVNHNLRRATPSGR
jgi:hypothetical protein